MWGMWGSETIQNPLGRSPKTTWAQSENLLNTVPNLSRMARKLLKSVSICLDSPTPFGHGAKTFRRPPLNVPDAVAIISQMECQTPPVSFQMQCQKPRGRRP